MVFASLDSLDSVLPAVLDLVDSVVPAALDLVDSVVPAAPACPVYPPSTEIKHHSGSDRLPHNGLTHLVKVAETLSMLLGLHK